MAYIPKQNQSVSGTVGASIIGAPYVGVFGSVATVGTAAANQSVSGTVQAQLQSTNASVITVGGSTGNSSVQVLNFPSNQSVSGSVGITGTPSISGTVNIGTMPLTSVRAVQQTDPWKVDITNLAGASIPVSGGSEATTLRVTMANDSTGKLAVLASIQGNVNIGTMPLTSIRAVQQGDWIISGSVQTVGTAAPNQSVSGQVNAVIVGGSVTTVGGSTGNSSVQVLNFPTNQSVSGSVGITGTPSISGAVTIVGASSMAALQGTNPWTIRGSVSGVGSFNVAVLAASIAGTYAEDSAHATASRGLFILGVRNDTLSSVTSTDGDYSPFALGPSGETIVANSPITKWISATTSVMSGPSVLVFSAPGASTFSYVSGVQVTNPGTTAAHVACYEGLGGVPASILFFAMAPAGGGSNMVFPNPIKTTLANKNISASVSAHASVYVMMEGFTAKQLT